jgi:hypothetical protein
MFMGACIGDAVHFLLDAVTGGWRDEPARRRRRRAAVDDESLL